MSQTSWNVINQGSVTLRWGLLSINEGASRQQTPRWSCTGSTPGEQRDSIPVSAVTPGNGVLNVAEWHFDDIMQRALWETPEKPEQPACQTVRGTALHCYTHAKLCLQSSDIITYLPMLSFSNRKAGTMQRQIWYYFLSSCESKLNTNSIPQVCRDSVQWWMSMSTSSEGPGIT